MKRQAHSWCECDAREERIEWCHLFGFRLIVQSINWTDVKNVARNMFRVLLFAKNQILFLDGLLAEYNSQPRVVGW
jgi:hypothetical protein